MFQKEFTNWMFSNRADTLEHKLKNVLYCFSVMLIWNNFWYFIFKNLFPYEVDIIQFAKTLTWEFLMSCIFAPLFEEMLFRVVPITIAKNLGRHYIFPVILGSSILFGYAHGINSISLMFQGVGGFILSILYIKNGFCYFSVVLLHFMWNFYVFMR